MKLALLTSTHQRHLHYAATLAQNFDVTTVICESKTLEPVDVGKNEDEDRLLANYFAARAVSEKEWFGDVKESDINASVQYVDSGVVSSTDIFESIVSSGADAVGVFGTSLIAGPLLTSFPGRVVNIHLGFSPYYRGSATNFWGMFNEELNMVGATLHILDAGVDTGEVVAHTRTEVLEDDSPHSLGNRAIDTAISGVVKVFKQLEKSSLKSTPQWEVQNPKVYRRADFTAGVLQDFLTRWDDGLVSRYLARLRSSEISEPRLITLND